MEGKRQSFEGLRKDAKFLNNYSSLVSKCNSIRFLDLKKTNKILRSLIAEKRQGGERLTRAGAILLIAPDPITGAAALPVLALAQILKFKNEKKNDMRRVLDRVNSDLTLLFSLQELSSSF